MRKTNQLARNNPLQIERLRINQPRVNQLPINRQQTRRKALQSLCHLRLRRIRLCQSRTNLRMMPQWPETPVSLPGQPSSRMRKN